MGATETGIQTNAAEFMQNFRNLYCSASSELIPDRLPNEGEKVVLLHFTETTTTG